jgi:hypothetical protein
MYRPFTSIPASFAKKMAVLKHASLSRANPCQAFIMLGKRRKVKK